MNRNDLSATHRLEHPSARRLCAALLIATASQLSFADTQSEGAVGTDDDASVTAEAPALVSTSFKELQLFADTFDAIRRGYVEDVSDADLFEMAVKGMLTSLDPHSAYLTDDDYDNLQESTEGQFTGLGIEIGYRGGFIAIVTPIDGSPAIDAGLQAGDVILKIDGTSTQGMSTSESSTFMRGPEGTDVVLEIGRAGESQPFDVVVTRGVIDVPSVRARELDEGYWLIRVSRFQRDSGREVTEAVQAALEKNTIKGLIIDVRNNPGGVMNASVEMASNFLDGGLVVYTKGRHPESMNTYNAEPGELIADVPIVVLVNGGSASASEIVAGALQDRGRAVIMGTQSFGKGSVQTVLPVSETKALKLTTSLYYTPSGRSIQAEGIIPDVVVERAQLTSLEQKGRLRESDLNRSIENKGSEAETETEAIASLREDDNQVYEAFTLLKGINVYQSLASESVDSGANSQAGTSETPKKVSTD
ncbi:MAG: putative CtpA-like serine protease [Halieaceae bacterium]|nr:MAG: putative CtpA-like serine protease [Halieaceae bacterium]